MASNPPSTCCTVGVKHEGETSGTTFKIGSIEAYAATPKENVHKNTAILFLPDVIGIWENSKLIADQFAANGYYTLLVDLFNGDPIPANGNGDKPFDFMKWMNNGSSGDNPHTTKEVDIIVEKSIEHLKGKGYSKIGSVGYCFGAKYVARYMAKSKGINVGYMAHPSFVSDEELSSITGPLSIAAAEVDTIFTTELRHKSEEILIKSKLPFQITLYGGVEHGFAVRADLSIAVKKFAKEKAFLQAVAWFDEYLLSHDAKL